MLTTKSRVASLAAVGALVWLASGTVRAERIGTSRQAITVGDPVDVATQQRLGLVTVNGGCSGTLMRQRWVLTARHCVTIDGTVAGPLLTRSVNVTATWASNTVATLRFYELSVNLRGMPSSDIVLLALGDTNFGAVANQKLFTTTIQSGNSSRLSHRLTASDDVIQYGRGFSSYASGTFGTPSQVNAAGLGTYRSALLKPTSITETSYVLVANGGGQVGHGGDSGGPTFHALHGSPAAIAGIQSTCIGTGLIAGAPSTQWLWATGIRSCQYVSLEPFVSEISSIISQIPIKPITRTGRASTAPAAPTDRAALRTVEVKLDVDVYATPGGTGQKIGMLGAGPGNVELVQACSNDWCHVRWPGNDGWVYSGEDYNSLGR